MQLEHPECELCVLVGQHVITRFEARFEVTGSRLGIGVEQTDDRLAQGPAGARQLHLHGSAFLDATRDLLITPKCDPHSPILRVRRPETTACVKLCWVPGAHADGLRS